MAVHIHVDAASMRDAEGLPERAALEVLLERAVRAVLDAHGIERAEISVALMDDAAIAELNRSYLGHEGPTDVISFELGAAKDEPIGDIYIGWEQALRQAAEFAVSPREELARLAVHGTLHVIGYDHPEGEEREQSEMWEQQEAIVREVVES